MELDEMIKEISLISMSLLLISAAPVEESPSSKMLNRLATLSGQWQGTVLWTGARHGTDKISATYSVSHFRSSVFENLLMDGVPYMTSVYHLDGADLRVTHFCVQSQPRLIADKIDPDSATVHFKLVDVTNAGPTSGFVDEIFLHNPDPHTMRIQFVFHGNGPRSVETIDLKKAA
jgi:hypothetical protein